MSTVAVNSALQRARAHLAQLAPAEDDLREPADPADRMLLDRYATAFESADIAALTELLRADATIEMPPEPFLVRRPGSRSAVLAGAGADQARQVPPGAYVRQWPAGVCLLRASGRRAVPGALDSGSNHSRRPGNPDRVVQRRQSRRNVRPAKRAGRVHCARLNPRRTPIGSGAAPAPARLRTSWRIGLTQSGTSRSSSTHICDGNDASSPAVRRRGPAGFISPSSCVVRGASLSCEALAKA